MSVWPVVLVLVGAGGGELFGEQGLIACGHGDDLYPRDRDR